MKLTVALWVVGALCLLVGCLPIPSWPFFLGLAGAINLLAVWRMERPKVA